MSERGVFALDRGWFDHPAFAREPFTEREAWAWLISEAAWKPHKRRADGRVVEVQRGQVCHSVRFMAEAWQWSKSRVDRFLDRLKKQDMIERESGTRTPLITICNYNKFQRVSMPERDNLDAPSGTRAGQERDKLEDIKDIKGSGGDNAPAPAYDEADLKIAAVALDIRTRISRFLEQKKIPLFPDMGMVNVWLKRGVAPSTILSVVCEGYERKTDILNLSYFDKPIARAHALAATPMPSVPNGAHHGSFRPSAEPRKLSLVELAKQKLAEVERREAEDLAVNGSESGHSHIRLIS